MAPDTRQPDRLNLRVWRMLAMLGAMRCRAGWYGYLWGQISFSPCRGSRLAGS